MSDTSIQVTCLDNLERHERLPAGAIAMLRESVERARVGVVLDAWAAADDERYVVYGPQYGGQSWYCTLWHTELKRVGGPFQAATADEARAAAARAIESGEV